MKRLVVALVMLASPAMADDYTVTLTDKRQIIALEYLRDELNKLRDPKDHVDSAGYIQEVVSGLVTTATREFKTDVTEIDAQIAELQAKRAEIIAKGGN